MNMHHTIHYFKQELELHAATRGTNSPEYPAEFLDVFKVLEFGISKGYAADGWLKGEKFDHKSNHASMCRHLAEHYVGKLEDDESKLNPLLHLACRALMAYTIQQRGKK